MPEASEHIWQAGGNILLSFKMLQQGCDSGVGNFNVNAYDQNV